MHSTPEKARHRLKARPATAVRLPPPTIGRDKRDTALQSGLFKLGGTADNQRPSLRIGTGFLFYQEALL